jgi:O-antigen ligase
VIVIAALVAAAAVFDRTSLRWLMPDPSFQVRLLIAAAAWAALATIFSTNRALSLPALLRLLAMLFLLVITAAVGRSRSIHFLALAIVPAIINAALCVVQELSIWNPFSSRAGLDHHMRTTALIGNPNDIGTYLALPGLAAIAAAATVRGRARLAYAAAAVVIFAGLVASQTLTAMLAFVLSAAVLMFQASWRRAGAAVLVALMAIAAVIAAYQPYRERIENAVTWARTGEWNALFTNRLTAFAAAAEMIRDRPVAGIGPGTFAWQYMPYKLRAEKRYPELRAAFNRGTNFGEAHNDHLQVAAEYGVPGYVILLAAAVGLAAFSIRARGGDDERHRLSRSLGAPVAVCVAVLALAQFPLQLAAVAQLVVTLAALTMAWSRA